MSLISSKKVKPTIPKDCEILVIGEAPGYDEDLEGKPFVGDAGQKLRTSLSLAGFDPDSIGYANCCNYRPANNKFEYLYKTWQLEEGLNEIRDYIARNKNRLKFVVLAGDKPLNLIGQRKGISKWRTSVLQRDEVNYFCCYHPSAIVRNSALYSTFTFDLRRLYRYYREGYTPPSYNFTINPQGFELEECLREIEAAKYVAIDIEAVKESTKILCCGFGISDSRGIVLPNTSWTGLDFVFENSVRRILENPDIKKIFQNGFGYDIEMFRENGIHVEGYHFDTMIATHVLQPELPYGLDYLTSIYTDQAYYKDKGKSAIPDDESDKGWNDKVDRSVLYDYNGHDICCTYTVAMEQMKEIVEYKKQDWYDYKMSLVPLGQELSRNGLPLDHDRKKLIKDAVWMKAIYYQQIVNAVAGYEVNVKGKTLHKLLLEDFKLPERKKDGKRTLDEDAIVSYFAFCQDKANSSVRADTKSLWLTRLAVCKCVLLVRGFRQVISNYINIGYSSDNRIRSVYNLSAATETGRGSSHSWIDGTGNNAQTWPRERLEINDDELKALRGMGHNI